SSAGGPVREGAWGSAGVGGVGYCGKSTGGKSMRCKRQVVRTLPVLCAALLLATMALASAEQVPFVDDEGEYIAYLDTQRDDTIYLWSGEPVAYLYSSGTGLLVYSFAGRHLGWYEDGILRDLS